jgi:hypothetical protein
MDPHRKPGRRGTQRGAAAVASLTSENLALEVFRLRLASAMWVYYREACSDEVGDSSSPWPLPCLQAMMAHVPVFALLDVTGSLGSVADNAGCVEAAARC